VAADQFELRWAGKRSPAPLPERPARLEQRFGAVVGEAPRDELHRGDNLAVLAALSSRARGRVNLIYLDPPFCSQAAYTRTIRLRGAGASGPRFSQPQYTDNWTGDEYLQFIYERLIVCRDLLDERGALVLHCDWHQSHRLRCILDEVFGAEMFQNEIIWHYYNKLQGNVGRFASNHDVLLVYAKSPRFVFNRIRERRPAPVRQLERVWSKAKGAIVNAKGPDGKVSYLTSTHKTIDDVWRLSMLQPADRSEAVGYPTQKPEALVERILAAASQPGDLVLDPFMGSGTTGAVALKLGRTFIGVDRHGGAVHTALRRLLRVREAIAAGGRALAIKNGLDDGVDTRPRAPAGLDVLGLSEPEPATDAQAQLEVDDGRLQIRGFDSPAVVRALGLESGAPALADWRAVVDSIFIDVDYDGSVLRPSISDTPGRGELVAGVYALPRERGVIAVRIVDVLGGAWTGGINRNDQ